MHYEHRVYEPVDVKIDALQGWFREHGLLAFAHYGIDAIGAFRPEPVDGCLSYITHFPDKAAHAAVWTANRTASEWRRANVETEADGPLIRGPTTAMLQPNAAGLLQV